MQGAMEEIRSDDLEQRQVRSAALQPMSVAAELRQPRAHSGSWLTRPATSPVVVVVGADPVEVVVLMAWVACVVVL